MHGDDGLRRAARALYDQAERGAGNSDGRGDDSLAAASRARVLARAERARRLRRLGDVCGRAGAAVLAAAALAFGRGHLLPGQHERDWLTPPTPSGMTAARGGDADTFADATDANANANADPRATPDHAPARAEPEPVLANAPEAPARPEHTAHAPHLTPRSLARADLPDVHRPALAPLGAAAFGHTLPANTLSWERAPRIDVPDLYARALPAADREAHDARDARDARGARVLAPVASLAPFAPVAPSVRAGDHANPTVTLVAWR